YGGQGNDFIDNGGADPGNDLIYGNFGNDTVEGASGGDTIYGGQGDDSLNGFGGNDFIFGNLCNDTLVGGEGKETLNSGLGADTFDFANTVQPPSGQTQATADHIADFQTGVDKVALKLSIFADTTPDYFEVSAPGATTLAQAIDAASAASAISNNEVIFVAGATDGYLLINANGDGSIGGANDFAIVLEGKNNPNLSDFAPTDLTFL